MALSKHSTKLSARTQLNTRCGNAHLQPRSRRFDQFCINHQFATGREQKPRSLTPINYKHN
eukprot:1161963-Pelagomonas_calceolata.AAC.10